MLTNRIESINLRIGRIRYKLMKALKIESEFSRRIKYRHKTFWTGEGNRDAIYRTMNANDPIEKWEDIENWQRKLSNKHNSRQFAIKHSCNVPELYWQGRDVDKIDFSSLPKNFVIRPITGSGGSSIYLIKDSKNLFDGKSYTQQELINSMSVVIDKHPNQEFLIEEFVTDEKGNQRIPDDYKFYMFNGEVACIQIINRLSPSRGKTSFYDVNWTPLPRVQLNYATGENQQAPKCLDEMVRAAKDLSRAYKIFARIDFYATHKGAVFGEITPTPFLGSAFTSFGNKLLISKWDKYCKGMI
ncbi:TupA-like ATPgrasp [Pontibacter indicus]|uniref:TupA-like ATPgrasp n=2 Tax=Pontibacter indicus TaxID=1317125 RepID=A0A1R3XPL9_9BACT|nr:TupA-like ATPgrasp [Pontibacter indicus]